MIMTMQDAFGGALPYGKHLDEPSKTLDGGSFAQKLYEEVAVILEQYRIALPDLDITSRTDEGVESLAGSLQQAHVYRDDITNHLRLARKDLEKTQRELGQALESKNPNFKRIEALTATLVAQQDFQHQIYVNAHIPLLLEKLLQATQYGYNEGTTEGWAWTARTIFRASLSLTGSNALYSRILIWAYKELLEDAK
jgi:hypothetical protein